MEHNEIITPDKIKFGVRASKVLYGQGKIDPDNEHIVEFQRHDKEGRVSQDKVDETVEAVVSFLRKDPTQAARIANFLITRTSKQQLRAIEGSFEVPDIRATLSLRNVLLSPLFEEVTANILTVKKSQLIVVKQKTKLSPPWRNMSIEMSSDMATFLTSSGVTS